ncbi:MAG: hypothetical protein V4662_03695 [Verrucomicrobiota bacterium]
MKPSLPSSNNFWILSSAYRDSGVSTLAMIRTHSYSGHAVLPCVFLFFRSIELSLKAVLVFHGVSENDITRKLGHRISELIARAEKLHLLDTLGVERADRELLDRFSNDYADKHFEYADDWWSYPHLDDLHSLADRICEAVQVYLMDNDSLASKHGVGA